MGKGYLIVNLTTANEAVPVAWANIVVTDEYHNTLYNEHTNESGVSPRMELACPDKVHSIHPSDVVPYAKYNIGISAEGYKTFILENVRILDTSETIQHVNMIPLSSSVTRAFGGGGVVHVENGEHGLLSPETALPRFTLEAIAPRVLANVIIPDFLIVHLARPEVSANNVRVSFRDYIKNVASHEIYDTWETAALEANIYCIISFTLNRIYTEFYRSRGYSFDITNSTSIDHFFKPNGAIGGNISRIVDYMFNRYLSQVGHKEPFLAQYCDGIKVKCPGWLTQWGSQEDALRGLSAEQIIEKFYNYDLDFRETNLFKGPVESYPGYALREGQSSEYVRTLQNYLNRIGGSFPLPTINPPNGYFGPETTAAVKKFQRDFNLSPDGIVGKATWYKINQIYVGVKGLSEMTSEGERVGIGRTPPTSTIREGSRGADVVQLQYLLNFISIYDPDVPLIIENGVFDSATRRSVIAFQAANGLTADGIVGRATWSALYKYYWAVRDNLPTPPPAPPAPPTGPTEIPPYPGYLLRMGSSGADVMLLQNALSKLAQAYPQIPDIVPDGQFGPATDAAVKTFQRLFGLSPDGIVGPATWTLLMEEYYDHLYSTQNPAYPGSPLRVGSRGEYVQMLQTYLNHISETYTQIPKLSTDGIFGSGTERAVKEFQRIFGLSPDGIVGPTTWAAIITQYNKIIRFQSPALENWEQPDISAQNHNFSRHARGHGGHRNHHAHSRHRHINRHHPHHTNYRYPNLELLLRMFLMGRFKRF